MRAKNNLFFITLAAFLLAPGLARAAVDTTLYIQGSGPSILVESQLVVPESCTVVDSVGVAHDFSGHRAICALQEAKDTGVIGGFRVTDWGFGFSLDSVNGLSSTPDWSELWQLLVNGSPADIGIQGIVLSEGDVFQLTYGPWPTGIIQAAAPKALQGGPIILDVYPRKVDVESAVSFLVSHQNEDGSFGGPLFTDWAAIALGAYGNKKSSSVFYGIEALKEWLQKNPVVKGSAVTDYERRAMALMALGVNPYLGTATNYIEAVMQEFDGEQFGSKELVNDDIFAALVLKKAGYQANVTPLLETLPFILSWQRESGSFGGVDLTAAAVQVLSLFPQEQERQTALLKAREYLASQQESSGGFGNVYSTSWALQAIEALNEDGDAWALELDRRTPEHFLALRQALDGGLLESESMESRVWASSYAIPAALQKSWGDILHDFEKPSLGILRGGSEPTKDEIEAFGTSLNIAAEKIEETAVLAENTIELDRIEQEVLRIAKEVEALAPQVAALYSSYLAQLKEPAQQFAQFQELNEDAIISRQEQIGGEQFTAEAAGIARNFFASSSGQAALVLLAGVVLFLLLGGWRIALSLMRRPRTAV